MFPDITKRQTGSDVVVSTELLEDLSHGRDLTEAAISDRTRATYQYEFKRFEAWAEGHRLPSLPTKPAIAATYLAHLSKRGAATATLSEPLRVCSRRWRIRKLIEARGGENWPFGLDDGFPPKPRRMHWRTYRRLEVLDQALQRRWCIGIGAWSERTDPRRRAARRARPRT